MCKELFSLCLKFFAVCMRFEGACWNVFFKKVNVGVAEYYAVI